MEETETLESVVKDIQEKIKTADKKYTTHFMLTHSKAYLFINPAPPDSDEVEQFKTQLERGLTAKGLSTEKIEVVYHAQVQTVLLQLSVKDSTVSKSYSGEKGSDHAVVNEADIDMSSTASTFYSPDPASTSDHGGSHWINEDPPDESPDYQSQLKELLGQNEAMHFLFTFMKKVSINRGSTRLRRFCIFDACLLCPCLLFGSES